MQDCRLPPRPQDLYTSASETVRPVVLLGDPLTGAGGDSTRTAFSKFNEHEHLASGSNLFTTTGARPGDQIQIYDLTGRPVLPTSAVITTALPQRLELDQVSPLDLRRGTALVQGSLGSVLIPNVVLAKSQSYVLREERSGFVEGRWLHQLATETLSSTWFSPPAGLHTLCLRLPYNAFLQEVWLQATAGRCNAALQIDQTSNAFPELPVKQTITAWSPAEQIYLAAGSHIRIQLRDLADLGNISISLTLIKHLR